jgi:hypothetical protein
MHVIWHSPCVYKRGGQGPFQRRREIHRSFDSSEANTHTLSTHILRPRSSSLSYPLGTPTTSTSVQDNTRPPSPLDVGYSSARTSINRLCSSCTLSGSLSADTYYSLVLEPTFLIPTVSAPGRGICASQLTNPAGSRMATLSHPRSTIMSSVAGGNVNFTPGSHLWFGSLEFITTMGRPVHRRRGAKA